MILSFLLVKLCIMASLGSTFKKFNKKKKLKPEEIGFKSPEPKSEGPRSRLKRRQTSHVQTV
jgi:hypothetical protein